ncbi:quinon protein alcohol dehydrogenase-like superfamily [Xylariales sp. PMI_506]|nr:quinon protein alcohol dehydrogenase-like superfamily [Xylariales sp. PMI_506]
MPAARILSVIAIALLYGQRITSAAGTSSPSSVVGKWEGWGGGILNNRRAGADAAISYSNVGSLSQSCQIQYDPGVSAPPLVTGSVAYYPTWGGLLVAVDFSTCETLWTANVTSTVLDYAPLNAYQNATTRAASRTTPVTDGKNIYIGTLAHALILAYDASDGRLVDLLQLDNHTVGIISQSPTYYNGQILMGVSSMETVTPIVFPDYVCCTFVGNMNAVSFVDGRLKLVWKTYLMQQPANVTGPPFSGAAVWGSQPAIDTSRGQVLIGTGNTYSVPTEFAECQNRTADLDVVTAGLAPGTCLPRNIYQESILALDLATGRINWAQQLGALDVWLISCIAGNNDGSCSSSHGPDADFGMAPTFVQGTASTPYGLDVVVIGEKSGRLWALSASAGTVLWSQQVAPGGTEGGLSWGIAADDTTVYFTAINNLERSWTLSNGTVFNGTGFGAASLLDGSILWTVPAPGKTVSSVPPTIVNDVLVTGTTGAGSATSFPTGSGSLIVLQKSDGQLLRNEPLNGLFHGAVAAVGNALLFGTGYYSSLYPPLAGSFYVYSVDIV